MSASRELMRTHARTLARGSSFIALGIAVGVVFSRHDAASRALACAALVVEIGSAIVVMRRSIRMIERMEKREDARPAERQ